MEMEEMNPVDEIISTIDSYIKNPKLVTPETLSELKQQVLDIKMALDQEDEPSEMENEYKDEKPENSKEHGGGLLITIGKAMKR